MIKELSKYIFSAVFVTMFSAQICFAGHDVTGKVTQMQAKSDGLYLYIPEIPASFCARTWASLNVFIPSSSPQYVYLYGIALASLTKNLPVYIANISTYNGSSICDITTTGYDMMLMK